MYQPYFSHTENPQGSVVFVFLNLSFSRVVVVGRILQQPPRFPLLVYMSPFNSPPLSMGRVVKHEHSQICDKSISVAHQWCGGDPPKQWLVYEDKSRILLMSYW